MKKLILLLLLLPSIAKAQINPTEWQTNGILTNPLTTTVLCSHVAPADETVTYHFVIAATVLTVAILQQVAIDGTTIIRSQAYIILASVTYGSQMQKVTLAQGETLRIVPFASVVGLVQCSLFRDN